MAIEGRLVLEDLVIEFEAVFVDGGAEMARVRITSDSASSEYYCNFRDLTNALSIAIHHDGMPDAGRDYDSAVRAQPDDPELRFIP